MISALAKSIFETQLNLNFPGLAKEFQSLIKEYKLPDITDPKINSKWSKIKWKKRVKLAIKEKCNNIM